MPRKILAMKSPFYFSLSKEAIAMRFIHNYLQNISERIALSPFILLV